MDLMARMMLAQDQMELPIGLVMKSRECGFLTTHLIDPHLALRGIQRGKRLLPCSCGRKRSCEEACSARRHTAGLSSEAATNPGVEVF